MLTDSAAVEQILFNLVDNACKYAADATDRTLHLTVTADARQILLRVRDHGPGVAARAAEVVVSAVPQIGARRGALGPPASDWG